MIREDVFVDGEAALRSAKFVVKMEEKEVY